MATGSLNLTSLFTCSFHRPNLRALPPTLDNALSSLREVIPPPDVAAVHSSDHLVSFAHHVQQILKRPVEVKELDGHRLVHILGQAVLARTPEGTLDLYVWCRSPRNDRWLLQPVEPNRTPFLDFPRTTLWTNNLRDALQREAKTRIGHDAWAERWAKWAWSWIAFKIVSRVDIRRLRSRIRGALDLDPSVLSLLRRRRRFVMDATWFVHDYNTELHDRERTLLLQREAPALLPFYWALREYPDFDRSIEPKRALREFARSHGVTPQQWKLIAGAGDKGQRLYRALCREFFFGDERHNAVTYFALVRLLRPKRLPPLDFWRQILSLCGTRSNPPDESYAIFLAPYQDIMRHLVRLADARVEAGEASLPAEDLHAVLAWIADCGIKNLTATERRGGWAFLVHRAAHHRALLRPPAALPLEWEPLLPPFEVDQLRVIPLASSTAVWEEALVMRHCADRYIGKCANRDAALFSLQRHDGKRIATLAFVNNGTKWVLLELAGKANSEPSIEVCKVAAEIDERMQGVPVKRAPYAAAPQLPPPEEFEDRTMFFDVNGVPVTLEPFDDHPWAWTRLSPYHPEFPRRFSPSWALDDGTEVSREEFFRRFAPGRGSSQPQRE
jgi:hypothetical protein